MDTNTCATVWLETACAAAAEPHTRRPLHRRRPARKHCTHQKGLYTYRDEADIHELEFFKIYNAISGIYCNVHCTSNRYFGWRNYKWHGDMHKQLLCQHTTFWVLMQTSPKQYLCSYIVLYTFKYTFIWLPLWSSGQGFWLQIQRSRVRFPALPGFLSGSGSGTGCTQPREPREVNWGATWIK